MIEPLVTIASRGNVVPGQIFMYREKRRFLMPQSGAGQVLGSFDSGRVVFLRVFNVQSDELTSLICFLPIFYEAFYASHPQVIRQADLPSDWDQPRKEWEEKQRQREAGAFTQELRDITADVLETVDYFRGIPSGQHAFIELAYPKRSTGNRFDTVAAVVRTVQD
jgi:hypothetical protein